MSIVIEFLLFLGVFIASRVFIELWRDEKKAEFKGPPPPALPSLPLIGSLPYLRRINDPPEFLLKSANQLGPIFTFRVGLNEIVVLNSKKSIEEAYVNHLSSFSGRAQLYVDSTVNPHRKGLIFKSTGAEWKRLHQLTLSILKEIGFGVKNEMEGKILVELEAMVKNVRNLNGQTFNPTNTIAMIATNVINNVLFGYRRDYKQGIGEVYIQMGHFSRNLDLTFELSSAIRFLPQFRDKLILISDIHKTTLDLLKEEVESCKLPEAEDCFVKRYLQREGIEYDESQLLFTLRDLIGGGSNTTVNTLLWFLATLADHPVVQERLRVEIDDVVPRHRFPSMNEKSRLPFVEATILETMRWKTLFPLAIPRVTLNDVKINGYFVSSGTKVIANLYAAHMEAKVWTEPSEFRPERFLDNENNVIGKDRVIPFSLGRRSCLGEVLGRTEIFLVVTAIVQNFMILPPEGQEKVAARPLEPIGTVMNPVPFSIRLIPRA